MKVHLFSILLATFILFISCSNSSGNNGPSTPGEQTNEVKDLKKTASPEASSGDGIVGEWTLIKMIIDENANDKMDANEISNPITNSEDYMKLNSDGSAEFYAIKIKGRYEIKENSGGKRYLNLFDKDNTKHAKGAIISVTKNELTLLNKFAGSTFTIWKRS
jgi:hypothetical protein